MPDGQQFDLSTAAKDPDFLAADMKDKIAFLGAHDQDFAKAPLNEQMGYLNHIVPTGEKFQASHTPAPEDTGVWNRLKQYSGDVGKMAVGAIGSIGASPVPTPGRIADIASSYASRAVPNKGQEGLAGARSPLYNAIATGAQATGMVDPAAMEESAEHGDPTGVLTHTAAQLTPLAVGEAARIPAVRSAAKTIADIPGSIRDTVSRAAYEGGQPKPIIADIGNALEHPTQIPGKLVKAGARTLFPPPPEQINAIKGEATAAELEQKMGEAEKARQKEIADNARMAREEGKQHKDFADTLRETEDARQKELADQEKLKLQDAESRERRGRQQSTIDKETEGKIPRIVSPTEGEPRTTAKESEGRGATWTNEAVLEEAAKGNRTGIAQAIVRKLPMPPNTRYIMGDPDYSRAVLNPREVTRFTPEGEPIRDKSNPQTAEPTARIPTISRTPRGRIPNIGESAPQGAALPAPGPLPETSTPLAAAPPAEAAPESTATAEAAKPEETAKSVRDKNETNAIRAELSEYNQKAKKWSDKIASARPSSWKAQRDWMDNLEAADKRVGQLKDALENGTPIKLGARGATKEELTVSYRNLSPENKAQVDDLASTFSNLKDAYAKKYFSDQYQLNDSRLKGLPTKEKLARFVTRGQSESDAMKFIRSLNENPDAEPVEETAQPEAKAGKIPAIGEAETKSALPIAASAKGKLPLISKPTEGAFKVPTTKPIEPQVPPDIEPVLRDANWRYVGKNSLGQHEIEEPGTNIKLMLFDRDLNPDFVRRKIAEKEKQYGSAKTKQKPPEGSEEAPF